MRGIQRKEKNVVCRFVLSQAKTDGESDKRVGALLCATRPSARVLRVTDPRTSMPGSLQASGRVRHRACELLRAWCTRLASQSGRARASLFPC